LLNFNSSDSYESFKQEHNLVAVTGATLTLALQRMGYQGVISSNNALSGDFKQEICLFPAYTETTEIVSLFSNNIMPLLLLEKLYTDLESSPKQGKDRIKLQIEQLKRSIK
jgi:hypothetical protein